MRGKLLALAAAAAATALLHTAAGGETPGDLYHSASLACMSLGGIMISHQSALIIATFAAAGLAVAIGVTSACLQWWRTARALGRLRLIPAASMPASVTRIARRLDVSGRIDIADTDALFALCHGILTPRLLVSAGLIGKLSDDQLEAVLRHEAAHLRRRDPCRILVARSIARACSVVPVASVMLEAYLCRREIEADDDSVTGMGDVLPLAGALQRMLSVAPAYPLPSLAVGALTATDVRIDRLLGETTSSLALVKVNRLHVITFAVSIAAIACVLLGVAHAAAAVQACVPC